MWQVGKYLYFQIAEPTVASCSSNGYYVSEERVYAYHGNERKQKEAWNRPLVYVLCYQTKLPTR